jgi:hypothetical protein
LAYSEHVAIRVKAIINTVDSVLQVILRRTELL